ERRPLESPLREELADGLHGGRAGEIAHDGDDPIALLELPHGAEAVFAREVALRLAVEVGGRVQLALGGVAGACLPVLAGEADVEPGAEELLVKPSQRR